jgi:hypothetical protein
MSAIEVETLIGQPPASTHNQPPALEMRWTDSDGTLSVSFRQGGLSWSEWKPTSLSSRLHRLLLS